jgi:predicted  nucleic acid-binding Zn-ribbon protein
VSKAQDANVQASSVASKARGGASFARGLMRKQGQRLQADKAAALQQLEQELRAEAAEQQQQAAAAHAVVVEGLQGEIQQHLQKQQQQLDIIRDISEERATLAAEQRQNKEAMVGLRTTISSLEQQLQESKQGHAHVRQQYETFCKEIAKEQGWKEALKLKMDEVSTLFTCSVGLAVVSDQS